MRSKNGSWQPLNSFVHAGIHAIHWTKFEPSSELLDRVCLGSKSLAILAFQQLAVLTRKPGCRFRPEADIGQNNNLPPVLTASVGGFA